MLKKVFLPLPPCRRLFVVTASHRIISRRRSLLLPLFGRGLPYRADRKDFELAFFPNFRRGCGGTLFLRFSEEVFTSFQGGILFPPRGVP